ncbi:hypothetical protein [Sinosporangium siamense]|uniref:Uncharacterized protein n=1 Tax=Sinosporangium siamense TaxID=1367973 RepID=A0A919RF02_9ACTN|nr:hypothetical protein [Sinosporangium siamense]GII91199.1 hypothetical protein Ssi02_14300 [Sinosporangium siamense]
MAWFVYRSPYEGPLGKRVRRLPDASVLDWFRRGFEMAGDVLADIDDWIESELNGDVYGLSSLFEAARAHRLSAPAGWDELGEVLEEHLYFEREVRVDPAAVRVFTDDDEVQVAYFFFDDSFVEVHPDWVDFQLWERERLPDIPVIEEIRENEEVSLPAHVSQLLHQFRQPLQARPFTPLDPVHELALPPSAAEGVTYVVVQQPDGQCLRYLRPVAITGARVPDLADRLREPSDEWDGVLGLLRALLAPDERELGPALHRCNRWPWSETGPETGGLAGEHAAVHERAMARLDSGEASPAPLDPYTEGRDPAKTVVHTTSHMVQMSIHVSGIFGYEQWFLFDDLWAAAHVSLARSLLRYGTAWDPLEAKTALFKP